MALSPAEMDRVIDEHFGYEASDDVDGVMASLAPDAEHEVVPSPVGAKAITGRWKRSLIREARMPTTP